MSDSYISVRAEPAAPAEGEAPAPAEGEAVPAEGGEAVPLDGEQLEEPLPIEKKKSPYPVFWNRPKAKMYGMNFDYGENYYRSMVNYLDHKTGREYTEGRRGVDVGVAS